MPDLDFMVVADYVRPENGVLHMIAAGIDTIYAGAVPSARQVGLGLRLLLTPAEAQYEHPVELIFQDPDGRRIAQLRALLSPQPLAPAAKAGRKLGVVIAFNITLPLPGYGDFSFELLVGGNHIKTIPMIISEPPQPHPGIAPGTPGHA
jgi:hypothetical protein